MKKKFLLTPLALLLVSSLLACAAPAPEPAPAPAPAPTTTAPVPAPTTTAPAPTPAPAPAPVVGSLLLEGEGLAPVTDETVIFRGWAYMTEIVEDNTKIYNAALEGNVDYATITGEYPQIMELQLAAGEPLDFLYAAPFMAVRYVEGGWILSPDELPNIDAIKADMYPNLQDVITYNGKLLGLPYYVSVRGIVQVNLKKYNALGFTDDDYPATWDELYDQLYEFRDRGEETPYMPHWFTGWMGASLGFIFEVLNRGGYVADAETHEPILTVEGPAGDTLRDWKRVWNDGLVPREVLGYREMEWMEAWSSGEYVYSPHQIYDIKRNNDPEYSTFAGYTSFLPYQGQPWGMVELGLYLITNRPRSSEYTDDVMRFLSWYGWKDQEGETFVAQRWMNEAMLFSAYKSVMESPETEATIKASLANPDNYEALLEVYSHVQYPKGVLNVVWAPEFTAWLMEELHKFLLDDLPVDETIELIRTKINDLNATYDIGG